jgi:hypothetical protein
MLLQTFQDADGGERLYSARGLAELACARMGRTAALPETVDGALGVLCDALEAARAGQTLLGKIHAQGIILDALSKQIRLADYLQRFPEIRAVALPDPILIVAPFRTGTTFLHRLLAQDPDNRTPRLWEVAYAPPVDAALRGDARYFGSDPRIARAEAALRGLSRGIPGLGALHPMGVDLAEECLGLLETSFMSHSFMFYADVPSYLDWLDGRSAAEWRRAYEAYLRQLQVLHWMAPGRHWVLKSPVHLWNLDILFDCFPGAHVVQLHRDPVAVVGSFCSLLAAYRGAFSSSADPGVIGRQATDYLRKALARGVAARRSLDPSRFIDISFDDLTADPLQAVRAIYARIGAELTDDSTARMRGWLARPAPARAARGPDPASFGIDVAAVRADFAGYAAFAAG